MYKHILSRLLVGVALTAVGQVASANTIQFTISGASASTSGVGLGTTVTVNPLVSGGYTFPLGLDPGESSSATFDFLKVTASGIGGVVGVVNAVLGFSAPIYGSASGVLGGFGAIFGLSSTGGLTVLNDPGAISFGDGGLFGVDFIGFKSSCNWCTTLEGTVQARVSLLSAPKTSTTSVPEPGTLSLLGAGLVAAALARRRRKLSS